MSKVDYCNSLYTGLPASYLRPLELVQNFAARLIFRQSKFCHIKPLLNKLHWLPISSRIKFKILLFVYKSLNNLAPKYLSSLISYYQPPSSLRSANQLLLKIPNINEIKPTPSFGNRTFSLSGPTLWNGLPYNLRKCITLDNFKKQLKTYLFTEYFGST